MRALLVVSTAAIGCQPPTQITLDISTSVDCGLGLETSIDAGPAPVTTTRCAESTIGTIVAVPSGSDDAEVGFEIATAIGEGVSAASCTDGDYGEECIVARRVLSYIPQRPLLLPIGMREISSQRTSCS